jgi:hypothetical protein
LKNIEKFREAPPRNTLDAVGIDLPTARLEFYVSRYPVTLSSGGKQYFATFNAIETAEVLKTLGLHAPFPKLLDARFMQASHVNKPAVLDAWKRPASMNSVANQLLHTKLATEGWDWRGPLGNIGKPNTWPLRLERIYGWHWVTERNSLNGIPLHPAVSADIYPGLKVIQRESKAHSGPNRFKIDPSTHCDYSMTVIGVGDTVHVCPKTADGTLLSSSFSTYEKVLGEYPELLGIPNQWSDSFVVVRQLLAKYGIASPGAPIVNLLNAFAHKIGFTEQVLSSNFYINPLLWVHLNV